MSPADRKIRLGVVGASIDLGGWASLAHLPAIVASPDFELAGVCTTRQESADRAAQAFGAAMAFDDYRTMIEHPDIDAVAVVVRVPSHFDPTRAAIEAGKPVYTEWPLGRTTAEAVELTALAAVRGVETAVGLQSRVNPGFLYMRDLIADGFVGEVMTCRVSLIRHGAIERPSSRTWQCDASLGANTLTIGGGHTLDALISLVGTFSEVSAVVSAEAKQWLETDTNRLVEVTSPDNMLVSGRLAKGGVASAHVSDTPFGQSGLGLDVYGREGVLIATGDRAPQYAEVALRGGRGDEALAEMPLPSKYVYVPSTMPSGVPFTVGQMYSQFARSIRDGSGAHPDFATAVALHRVLDAVQEASDTGRRVTIAPPVAAA